MYLKNITVKYGSKTALNSIDLSIKDQGQIIGLLGPNGAGKTTLINLLVGNINKYTGQLNIDQKNIAYCPDRSFLYANMTVIEAINLFSSVYVDFDRAKALKIMKKLHIALKMKVGKGSKGMQEQIHIALTLSRNTPLYIFDEPLASVDPLTRDYLIKLIVNNQNQSSNIIISTHLIQDIDYIFNSVIIINQGKILLENSVDYLVKKEQKPLEKIFKEVVANDSFNLQYE